MPVYEYQCKGCGHEFEREQRISEAPVKKCPSCGALKARRQISRTSFVLKGGGWYSDLYGTAKPAAEKSEPAKSADSTSADAAPAASSSESKSDAGGKSDTAGGKSDTAGGKSDGGGKGDSPGKGPKKGGKGAKAAA